jgi:pimeloyl-ACP methyl ester carboxylesterase
MWGSFPEQLAETTGCGVFLYSRAGYGQSSPAALPRPLNYMTDEARETLPKVLDTIGFRRGLFVGHSDGASIAAIYAGSHQDHRVRGLVLIAPHFICEDITHASIAELRKEFETGDLRARLARWHADVDATVPGWSDVWLGPDFRNWDISEYLAYIRVPVLIMQGEDDHYGTMRQIEIAREECYCPVEVALLAGARHVPQREAPEATMRAVTEFIARLLQIDCLGQQSAAG